MENQRNSKVPILESLSRVISPINMPDFAGGRHFHHSPLTVQDSPSPLMKYMCSSSPAHGATVPSPPVFTTPLKAEENVLVMDGIPVPESSKGGRARGRSTLPPLGLNSTSLSQAGGVGAENGSSNKVDMCRHGEDSGICHLGSKCQFAHGMEELCTPRFSPKNKPDIFKSYISSNGSSSSSDGQKSCSVIAPSTAAAAPSFPTPPKPMASSTSTLAIKPNSVSIDDSKATKPALSCSDWSPLDDGIEVTLPPGLSERRENPSKEDLEAHIQKVLYGRGSTKRLPVFLNICSD